MHNDASFTELEQFHIVKNILAKIYYVVLEMLSYGWNEKSYFVKDSNKHCANSRFAVKWK